LTRISRGLKPKLPTQQLLTNADKKISKPAPGSPHEPGAFMNPGFKRAMHCQSPGRNTYRLHWYENFDAAQEKI